MLSSEVAQPYDPRVEALFEGTPYRGVRRLGAGGMGEVHLVEHRELGRQFVAKVVRGEIARDPQHTDRFRLEAQALGRLNHPHVVSVVGLGHTSDGRPFLVTESLRGRTLADELRARTALPSLEAVTYACQILSALEAAHSVGLVHRDIKPSNVFVCESGKGAPLLKVLDFGLARVLPHAPARAPAPLAVPTATGAVLGTPRFVSPEAARRDRVDHRADLYAAGLVLYLMLAGRGPFDHVEGPANIYTAHARASPAPPSRFATLPVFHELDQVVLRALRKAPEERYQSAREFRHELEQVAALLTKPTGWLCASSFDAEVNAPAKAARRGSVRERVGRRADARLLLVAGVSAMATIGLVEWLISFWGAP